MENSAFKKWLKRRVAREAAANVFLALLAYPGASARMITDLLFTGPRLVVVAWGALKKALRLVRMDIEGCSRVLAVLGSSDSRVSCDELAELSAVPDADRVLSQLRDI